MALFAGLLAALFMLRPATASAGLTRDRIFQPPAAPLSLDGLPATARLIEVRTADGLALKGIEVPPRGDRPVVLLFHGNASSAASALAWLAPLVQRGYGVVAAEYRGYSANPGAPSEAGLGKDADAFYAAAKRLAGAARVIVVGHSLGGGVAFGLARHETLAALVTIGAFASIPAVAPAISRPFVTDRFDNLAAVPTLDEPLFLIHGTADDVIPAGNGAMLHAAAVKAKRRGVSFVVEGAGHQPPGEVIAAIVDCIADALDSGTLPAAPPAPSVKAAPYGGFAFAR